MTNEMLRQIFSAYSNRLVKYVSNEIPYTISYITKNGIKMPQTGLVPFSFCKLILTPLDAITDEQIYQCYKQIDAEMYNDDFNKEHFISQFSPKEISENLDRWGQSAYYILVDYLRSIGFDMGYGSIPSLIDANVAITSKK